MSRRVGSIGILFTLSATLIACGGGSGGGAHDGAPSDGHRADAKDGGQNDAASTDDARLDTSTSDASDVAANDGTSVEGPGAADTRVDGPAADTSPDAGSDASDAGVALAPISLHGCALGGYWAPVAVGATQTFQLLLDPGSATTAVVGSTCTTCSGVSPVFTPDSLAKDQGLTATQQFADNTSWKGEIFNDVVALDGPITSLAIDMVDVSMQSGYFSATPFCDVSQGNYQGVLGIGRASLHLAGTDDYLGKVAAAGVPDVFATKLCAEGGTFWLGGFDEASVAAPPAYTPLTGPDFDTVTLSEVDVGGSKISGAATPGTIVDFATGASYLPTAVVNALIANVSATVAYKTLFSTQPLKVNGCVTTTAIDLSSLPTMTMMFPGTSGAPVTVQLPATQSYLTPLSGSPGTYCLSVAGSGLQGPFYIGGPALQGQVVIVDRVAGRLGFAPPRAACP